MSFTWLNIFLGEICNPNPRDKTKDGRYRIACPCDAGLSCQLKKGASMVRIVF